MSMHMGFGQRAHTAFVIQHMVWRRFLSMFNDALKALVISRPMMTIIQDPMSWPMRRKDRTFAMYCVGRGLRRKGEA